jgi:hypothetical protein
MKNTIFYFLITACFALGQVLQYIYPLGGFGILLDIFAFSALASRIYK